MRSCPDGPGLHDPVGYAVAALCVRRDSVYKALPGVDTYDADRDVRSFASRLPVIAHPPCRGWGRLRHRSNHTPDELDLARLCLHHCRANGGVLEHPASSALWADEGLPRPGQPPSLQGWTLAVDQSWWGHPSRKRTWLFIVGRTDYPPLPFALGWSKNVEDLGRSAREHTPPRFASWLIDLASGCQLPP